MLSKLILIGVAGALGTLARYGLAGVVQTRFAADFPYGTLAVNLVGCLLFGVLFALTDRYAALSTEARIILLVGFMGGFTTFSTFAYETQQLLESGQWLKLALNMLGQNLGGLACVILGLALGRLL